MLIDVHHHYLPDFLVQAFGEAGRRPSLSGFPAWSLSASLQLLDRIGADQAILSAPPPGIHFGDPAAAAALAHRCNDFAAELSVQTAGRLAAFATLPLPDVEAACEEAVRVLDGGLAGVGVLASYGEVFFGDAQFDPLMGELNRRDAVLFVHPVGHPSSRALSHPAPLWMLEYPFDTTRAALNMILGGIQDRFPNIRIILAHAGGALPFLSVRLREMSIIDHRFAELTPERIDRYLGKFYYDLAQTCGPATFAALDQVAGEHHLLFGSDFPYCGGQAIQNMVDNVAHLRGGIDRLREAGGRLYGPADPSGRQP